jgi:hypothetical protein
MAKQLAEKVHAEALAGKDFAELARTYSEDEGSRGQGGELPPISGNVTAAFENAAKALTQPGEVSSVVTTKSGFHVIQLIGREPGRQRTFEEVKPELVKTLAKEHAERYAREHTDQLRSMALDADPELVGQLADRYLDKPAAPDGKAKPPARPLIPDMSKALMPEGGDSGTDPDKR